MGPSWLIFVTSNITKEYCSSDNGGIGVWLVCNRNVAAWDIVSSSSDSLERGAVRAKRLPRDQLLLMCYTFCAVECRRWLRVAVCTPPKTPPSCCRRVHLCFEGFSQVHINFMHCVVAQCKSSKKNWTASFTVYQYQPCGRGKIAFDCILLVSIFKLGMYWCDWKILSLNS